MNDTMTLKSDSEIEIMKEAGAMLREVLQRVPQYLKPGITTADVNAQVEEHICELGGEPGFKTVPHYDWGTCVCINQQIVHSPPSDRIIKDGDVVTVDAGVLLKGLHTDSALTIQVGTQDPKVTAFLETGRKALNKAIKAAKVGNRIGHISQAFQDTIEPAGYSIVRELTGHGVGKELHEDPYVPCFLSDPSDIAKTRKLVPGMTLALEVMYAMGGDRIVHEEDGWSIKMADESISACSEHTVAITEKSTFILT